MNCFWTLKAVVQVLDERAVHIAQFLAVLLVLPAGHVEGRQEVAWAGRWWDAVGCGGMWWDVVVALRTNRRNREWIRVIVRDWAVI